MSARLVALDALLRVAQDDAYLDRALPPLCDKASLAPEDRGLATEIAFGVLRRQMWLDTAIAHVVDRPMKDLDLVTLTALRVGVYQLHALDRIPPHAAVSETVEAAKARQKSAASFVNAVLRKLSTTPPLPDHLDDDAATPDQLALGASAPPWILRAFDAALSAPDPLPNRLAPKGTATLHTIARALGRPAQPTLRVLSRRLARDALLLRLQNEGADAHPTVHSRHGIRVARIGDPSLLQGFGHDLIAQDEAAQWAASLAEGEKGPALDACAAPGGKALALWDAGVEPLFAIEKQPKRAELLRRTLAKAAVPCAIHVGDAATPPKYDTAFNTVFIDAPCTGSGTLIRHPELRWKIQKPSLHPLVETQHQILDGMAPLVAPGGALVYAVCSVFPEEGAQQIAQFLQRHASFELVAWLETLSYHDTMDGFFAAKLRNRADAPSA
jgi:16S rRNA (cytosine967-C5)-methyltransferase